MKSLRQHIRLYKSLPLETQEDIKYNWKKSDFKNLGEYLLFEYKRVDPLKRALMDYFFLNKENWEVYPSCGGRSYGLWREYSKGRISVAEATIDDCVGHFELLRNRSAIFEDRVTGKLFKIQVR